MTDELDRLRAALQAPPPAPGSQARMAALEAAMKNFDDLHAAPQGIADAPRSSEASQKRSGLLSGVWSMLKPLARPGVLAASTSVVAALPPLSSFRPTGCRALARRHSPRNQPLHPSRPWRNPKPWSSSPRRPRWRPRPRLR